MKRSFKQKWGDFTSELTTTNVLKIVWKGLLILILIFILIYIFAPNDNGSTSGNIHDLAGNIVAELIGAFLTVIVIQLIFDLPAKKIKNQLRNEIESINFNFNYALTSFNGFSNENLAIFENPSKYKDDDYKDFIYISNRILSALNEEKMLNNLKEGDDFKTVEIINNENIIKINNILQTYSRILSYEDLELCINLRTNFEYIRKNLNLRNTIPKLHSHWDKDEIERRENVYLLYLGQCFLSVIFELNKWFSKRDK